MIFWVASGFDRERMHISLIKQGKIMTNLDTKFLIVDDFPTMRRIIKNLLKELGYKNFEEADDGAMGLERLTEFAPDAVLLDLMMPKLNGFAVLKAIRAQEAYHHLPVLVLTSASIPTLVEQALLAGANRVFDKANDKPLAVVGVFHGARRILLRATKLLTPARVC